MLIKIGKATNESENAEKTYVKIGKVSDIAKQQAAEEYKANAIKMQESYTKKPSLPSVSELQSPANFKKFIATQHIPSLTYLPEYNKMIEKKTVLNKAQSDYEKAKGEETYLESVLKGFTGESGVLKAQDNYIKAKKDYSEAEKAYKESKNIKPKGPLEKTEAVMDHTANIIKSGAADYAKGISSTADMLLGNVAKALGFKNNVISDTNKYYTDISKNAANKMQKSAERLGDKNDISGTVGANVVRMIPDAIIAFCTGGGSLGIQAVAKSGTLLEAAQSGVRELAKNPMFYTSFIGEVGNDYEDAKKDGASEAQATLTALLSATVNSIVEVGGGIQKLPGELQGAKNTREAVIDWVKSSIDEGKEEVIQDFISGAMSSIVYDRDKPVLSTSDENAVINPSRMLKEGAMGALVGGIAGGGQLAFSSIVNASNNNDFKNIGKAVINNSSINESDIIRYGRKSYDSEIRSIAEEADETDAIRIGQLYSFACRDIDSAINSPEDINIVNENFNNIVSDNNSDTITAIASSQYISRLMDMGIDENSAKYMSSNNVDEHIKTTDNLSESPDSENAELQSTANEADQGSGDAVFHEPSTAEIAQSPNAFEIGADIINGREHKNSRQLHIEKTADKLGVRVAWDNKVSRGKYNPATKTIFLNPNVTAAEAYAFVFKHEVTHWMKDKKGFDSFSSYLFDKSSAFEDYTKSECENLGIENDGTREGIITAYTNYIFEQYRSSKELMPYQREKFSIEDAKEEMICNFVADSLLGGKNGDASLHNLQTLATENRTAFQKLIDWVRSIINRLKGDRQFRSVSADLEYLEQRLKEVYRSAENKNTAAESDGVKFSIKSDNDGENVVVIDTDQGIFAGVDETEYRTVAKEYLNKHFKNTVLPLSDYNLVSVGKTGINKYAYSGKKIENDAFYAKMKASTELDNLLKTSEYLKSSGDRKNHNFAKYGFDYFKTRFIVGGQVFEGVIDIGISEKGAEFYGMTNIENVTSRYYGKYSDLLSGYKSVTQDDIYNNNLSQDKIIVNNNISQTIKKDTKKSYIAIDSYGKLLDDYESGKLNREEFLKEVSREEIRRSAEYDEHIQKMTARYETEISKQKETISRQKKQIAKTKSENIAETRAEIEERRDKQKNVEYIRRIVNRIDKKLRSNTEKSHVPEGLKDAVFEFCKTFIQNDTSPFDKKTLAYVYKCYNDLKGNYDQGGETLIGAYDFEIADQLKNLGNTLDGKKLRDLSNFELNVIRDIVDNFQYIIVNEEKLFIDGRKYDINEIGYDALQDFKGKESKERIVLGKDKFGKPVRETLGVNNMIPAYFFKRMGKTFQKLYNDMLNGMDKWTINFSKSKDVVQELKKKYRYSRWDKDVLKFRTKRGDDITLTREQAMLVYATAKRERSSTGKEAEHLMRGGIVFEDEDIDGLIQRYKKAEGEGKEKIKNTLIQQTDTKAHQLWIDDLWKIADWLTEDQKGYVDDMVKYLSNDMSALGNEISMKLFGIRKFNEEYYIPYNSASNYLYSQPGVSNDQRIKHQSFTKETVYKANNPLVVSDFSTVCADHIIRMCTYNALTIPLDNLNRLFNYKTESSENTTEKSVKAEIERTTGAEAVKYVEQLIKDVNGSVRTNPNESLANTLISKFKKGAVFASASVVIQQPSALARAFALINPKYFVQTTFKVSERSYEQCKKYCPVAVIKEMGRFDTGIGVNNIEWLLKETPEGIKGKLKALITDGQYRDDKLSTFAAKADEFAWGHIWAAVKAETKDTTDFKPGSEDFYEAAANRFREVINFTQVYDSTLSRSQNMRDKGAFMKTATAFLGEPTLNINMLDDAAYQAKTGGKKGKQYAARAIGAFVSHVILNSLLKSLVTAARDDDKDKSYIEKYISDMVGNSVSDMFIPDLLPIAKDIVSIFEGYSTERADMALFSDLADTFKLCTSDTKSTQEKILSLSGSIAAFFELPLKNVVRDVKAAFNVVNSFKNGNETDANGIKYSVLEGLGRKDTLKANYSAMAKALEDGDEKKYSELYEHMQDLEKTDADIYSGIKSQVKKSVEIDSKDFNKLSEEDQSKVRGNIAGAETNELYGDTDTYDELYKLYRTNRIKYKSVREDLIKQGKSATAINDGFTAAKIKYLSKDKVDLTDYYIAKILTGKSYADQDKNGRVTKAEMCAAIDKMEIDSKTKAILKRII